MLSMAPFYKAHYLVHWQQSAFRLPFMTGHLVTLEPTAL